MITIGTAFGVLAVAFTASSLAIFVVEFRRTEHTSFYLALAALGCSWIAIAAIRSARR